MTTTLCLAGVLGFVSALVLTPASRMILKRCGVVDYPDGGRKRHRQPIPRAGGPAIAASYIAAHAIFLLVSSLNGDIIRGHSWFLLKMTVPFGVIFITGLLDDFFGLRVWQKLSGQAIAGVLTYIAGVRALATTGQPIEVL